MEIKRIDWLLILAAVLTPMTGLRVWKIGPAELLAFTWCVCNYQIFRRISKRNPVAKFWLMYLFCSIMGTFVCIVRYPKESNWSDLITWIYMAVISFVVYTDFDRKSIEQIQSILEQIAKISVFLYMLLFIYAQGSRSILGAPLWLGYRFTGGAENPHQVALLLAINVITGLWMFMKNKGARKKIEAVLVCVGSFFLLLQTASSTALLAVAIGAAVMMFESWVRTKKNTKRLRIGALTMGFIAAFIFAQPLLMWFYDWIASDVNGLHRLSIFATYSDAFWKSPIFGLGPGSHGMDGQIEFHNMYLEVLAMSGVLGGSVFLFFTKNVFSDIKNFTYGLGILGTLYAFGLAGFSMRRLVFWIMLSAVYAYSKKLRGNEKY